MGVQTTVRISRTQAIQRILKINKLVKEENYKAIEETVYEPGRNVIEFVVNGALDVDGIQLWTNEMLENTVDKPFFRLSMYENYLIEIT